MADEQDTCALADRACAPCRGGIPALKGAELQKWSTELGGGWQTVDEHHLTKTFAFPDFRQALAFTNRIGELAEKMGHHPDIELSWGRVAVKIWTHKVDGLADADFILAAKIDRLTTSPAVR